MKVVLIAAGLLITSSYVAAAPAYALECPVLQDSGAMVSLSQSRQQARSDEATLAARGSAAVPSMIYRLRQTHADATNAEITNYLIAVYCPTLNHKKHVSNQRRRADLMRFAAQVRNQL